MAIANLRVPISALPKHDSASFFDSLSKSLGGVVDEFGQRKSYNALADRIATPTSVSPVTSPAPPSSTASAYGVAPVTPVTRGPIPDAYFSSIRSAESGGNDFAKNPNSSATGRYQFTEGTWNGLIKQYPELGLTSDGRLDPNQQEKAIRVFTQDNARALSGNGIPVNPANLYAAHFLGAGGANSVLSQPDEAPISNFVSADVVKANPFLNGMTVGKFKEWAASKAGNGAGGYSAPTSVDAVNSMAEGGVSLPNEYAGGGGRPSNIPGYVSNAVLSDAPATNSNVNNILAQGVTPIQRGGVDPSIIQFMLRDPNLREVGVKLWAANAGQQKSNEPWQFAQYDDGTVVRANQQTGEIQAIGKFAKGSNGKLGGDEAGLNLVYGQDKDGRTVAFQPLKGGGLRQVELPDGVILTPGISNIDTGTGTRTVNTKTGAVISDTPKDLTGKTDAEATGKIDAEARSSLPQVQAAGEQMLSTIDSLSNDEYLNSMVGAVDTWRPNLSSSAARVQSKMDQIGGQSFLQAFNMLRGGGQITEQEGTKATAAMARLNTAQNEKDYREALSELRGIVVSGINRARAKAGQPPISSSPASGAPNVDDLVKKYGG